MRILIKNKVKWIVTVIALLNIIVLMLFQYGLPSPAEYAERNNSIENAEDKDADVGTIEAVAQETAAEEAETAGASFGKEEAETSEGTVQTEAEDEEQDPDAPVLELTDDHIYLSVGDHFNYMSYIKTMEDVDGSDLSHYIHLDKNVDTSVPGDFELTYRITSTITGKTSSKVLLITVQ